MMSCGSGSEEPSETCMGGCHLVVSCFHILSEKDAALQCEGVHLLSHSFFEENEKHLSVIIQKIETFMRIIIETKHFSLVSYRHFTMNRRAQLSYQDKGHHTSIPSALLLNGRD